MKVLGIGDHVNCGSALVEDGEVVAAINDERLVREKMVFGVPRESVKKILEMKGLTPDDIDAIAVATKNQHFYDEYLDFRGGWFGLERGPFKQALFDVASYVSKLRSKIPFLDNIYYTLRAPAFRQRRNGLRKIFRNEFGFSCPIHFLDHHFCHATSAYYTSGYDNATVFSIDGGGDGKSGKVYDVTEGKFDELSAVSSFASLGNFYSYITQICGFDAGRHEGKITGLAAYGDPEYVPILRKILVLENGRFKNVGNVFFHSAVREIERLLPEDFSHKNLAASIQEYAEELVTGLVEYWLAETGRSKVALAGGVCANVKINQRVHELSEVDSVYVHPGMTDAGMPVGAALGAYFRHSEDTYQPDSSDCMQHVYLGPEYSEEEIRSELESEGIDASHHQNVEEEVARLLADGAVVARFNGRMEYGPRALGNRSILYQPTDPSVQFWLNESLDRTEFMPFAPVVLREHVDQCFVDYQGAEDTARFMTITFECTDWMAEHCPGVVHIDKTARPQVVSEKDNPSMYRILSHYYDLTGLPVLINTSFNMHEEPIVCTPSEAVRSFKQGHLDYLAIGNWLAENPSPLSRDVDRSKHEAALEREGKVDSSVQSILPV